MRRKILRLKSCYLEMVSSQLAALTLLYLILNPPSYDCAEHSDQNLNTSDVIRYDLQTCSRIFCGMDLPMEDVNKCKASLGRLCRCIGFQEISCQHQDLRFLRYSFDGFSQHLKLFSFQKGLRIETALPHVESLFQSTKLRKLMMSMFCDTRVGFVPKDYKCFVNFPADYYSNLDFDMFSNVSKSLEELVLRDNCFSNVVGKFSETFPDLRTVNLEKNFIGNLSLNVFSGLRKLEFLDLSRNRILSVTRAHFEDLVSLEHLDVSENCISNVAEDTFRQMSNLQDLNLGKNGLKTLPEKLFFNNNQLKTLVLDFNDIHSIPESLFIHLQQLERLSIGYNKLNYLNDSVFKYLSNVEQILLDENHLEFIPPNLFANNPKLINISFNSNPLKLLPKLHIAPSQESSHYFSFLNISLTTLILPLSISAAVLDISENCIEMTRQDKDEPLVTNSRQSIKSIICHDCCLRTIPHGLHANMLKLTKNRITELSMVDLDFLSQADQVDLSLNKIERLHIEWNYPVIQQTGKNSRTNINLGSNPIICDCQLFPFLVFIRKNVSVLQAAQRLSSMQFNTTNLQCSHPAELHGKSVSDLVYSDLACEVSAYKGCPSFCFCYYKPDENVTVVNCSNRNLNDFSSNLTEISGYLILHLENNNITSVPEMSWWSRIKALHLSHNNINDLSEFPINDITNLAKLFLDNNLLENIDRLVLELLKHNPKMKLSLSGNPLKCTCDLVKNKLSALTANVVDLPNATCLLKNLTRVLLVNVTEQSVCLSSATDYFLLKVALSCAVGFLLVIGVVVVLGTCFVNEIKLWLFVHSYCLKWVSDEEPDADKTYDAFVSYSSLDEDWVCDVLVSHLENGVPPYKLCLHDRDWLPGEQIPNQILESVKHSRRTLIVLTENFVNSDWSRLELLAAYQQMVQEKMNRVIVIVPQEFPDVSGLTEELQTFLTINTYLKWNQTNFWKRLHLVMPHVRKASTE